MLADNTNSLTCTVEWPDKYFLYLQFVHQEPMVKIVVLVVHFVEMKLVTLELENVNLGVL